MPESGSSVPSNGQADRRESRPEELPEFAQLWLQYRESAQVSHEEMLYPALLRHLGEIQGQRLLDAGCGEGSFLALVRDRNPKALFGIDLNRELISHCSQREISGAMFVAADLTARWPLEDRSFDRIVSSCVAMHMNPSQLKSFMNEAGRVLADNGRLVIAAVHVDWAKRNYPIEEESEGIFRRTDDGSVLKIVEYHYSPQALIAAAEEAKLVPLVAESILLDDRPGLSERYSSALGTPIFCVLSYGKRV